MRDTAVERFTWKPGDFTIVETSIHPRAPVSQSGRSSYEAVFRSTDALGLEHDDQTGQFTSKGSWGDPLPPEQASAVTDYTDLGYMPVNEMLRGGNAYTPAWATPEEKAAANALRLTELEAEVGDQIDRMRAALRPTPEDMTVYRGTHSDAFGLPYRNNATDSLAQMQALVGQTRADKAFMSTSLGTQSLFYGGSTITMEIAVPKGTLAINADPVSRFHNEGGSGEVILGPSTNWRIDSVELVSARSNDFSSGNGMLSPDQIHVKATVVP